MHLVLFFNLYYIIFANGNQYKYIIKEYDLQYEQETMTEFCLTN